MKRNLIWLLMLGIIYLFFGCGGGGGGSTSAITGGGGTSTGIPSTPAAQIQYAVEKVESGDYASARTAFEAAESSTSSSDSQKRQTATGVLLCDIKLDSTDLGDDDLISSLLLIVNPASTSFAPMAAATAEVTIPS
ncbi:MAG: hypothetical protein PHQ23_02515, partial [Candidatus Wallbacteria bacterium]|nr:hypothetical protein [Candidatus Wallbacteria bacterium]